MKQWSPDHPKAKLMDRKRKAILDAARGTFLEAGYGGTSMESIARAAGVSIMTLYRHARSKDELFAAIIESACEPADDRELSELEEIMRQPLGEVLVLSAIHMQEKLTRDDTTALMRIVIAEAARFPGLAELAYAGLIQRFETVTAWILSQIEPTASETDEAERSRLAHMFVDRIIGVDLLRALLGLGGAEAETVRCRALAARDDVLRHLSGLHGNSG